ncbi:MAG: hypothetical protein V4592_20185 [Bacteroidota bacterium]
MALYRFRISFEDYDDVMREIDVKSNQTFEDLHRAIHKSTGYDPEKSASFYISNDQWTKGEEITYLPNQKRIDRGISLMEKVRLSSFIDDPHQKFYYTFNFDRPYDFHVELMKIILDEDPKLSYPHIVKSVGEAPKMFSSIATPTILPPANDDFDFLNEIEFVPEDAEDFSEVTDTGVADEEEDAHGVDADDDDEMDEFSDNEHMEDESGHGHDDY